MVHSPMAHSHLAMAPSPSLFDLLILQTLLPLRLLIALVDCYFHLLILLLLLQIASFAAIAALKSCRIY